MSKFHESVREILQDVSDFLTVRLQDERLSAAGLAHRESLLLKLNHLSREYEQLNLNVPEKPSSPLPYVDMNGGGFKETEYVLEETGDHYEEYVEEIVVKGDLKTQEVSPTKCGYLEKKVTEGIGRLLAPSAKRWCILKDNILRFYNRPEDKKELGNLELDGCEARAIVSPKDGASFELVCPGKKTHQFTALHLQDMDQWIEAINQIYDDNTLTIPNSPTEQQDEEIYEDGECTRCDVFEVENPEDWYVALWDCATNDPEELLLCRGDVVQVVSKMYDASGWWIAEKQGQMGLVPNNYLTEAYEIVLELSDCTKEFDV